MRAHSMGTTTKFWMVVKLGVSEEIFTGSIANADARSVCGSQPSCHKLEIYIRNRN